MPTFGIQSLNPPKKNYGSSVKQKSSITQRLSNIFFRSKDVPTVKNPRSPNAQNMRPCLPTKTDGDNPLLKVQPIFIEDSGQQTPDKEVNTAERFGRRVIISSDSDPIIRRGAKCNATHRRVPTEHRYTLDNSGNPKNFGSVLGDNTPLSSLTIRDRIDLHGHGSTESFENFTPSALAEFLINKGLTNIGVIKIQSCDAGKKNFLIDLKNHLIYDGVNVGYLSGPKSGLSDMRFNLNFRGHSFNILPIFYAPKKIVGFLPEKFNLRVVKGNADISFSGTRYQANKKN
jgi:hypothetical protein